MYCMQPKQLSVTLFVGPPNKHLYTSSVERDEFIQELLVYLKSFWSKAVAGRITTVNKELDHFNKEICSRY